MKIVILGCAGAGKDTLSNQITKKFDYIMLSPGSIFRREADERTELGLYAKDKYWGKGNLCPDNIVNSLVENTINKLPNTNNVIFNGYPRSLKQAEFLNSICDIDLVIDLNIHYDIMIKRLSGRGRADDSDEIVKQRYQQYNSITKPISEFYEQSQTKYITVNTDRPPKEVFELVLDHL